MARRRKDQSPSMREALERAGLAQRCPSHDRLGCGQCEFAWREARRQQRQQETRAAHQQFLKEGSL